MEKICQGLPRQPAPVQRASVSPHATLSSFQSSKFGKHTTCVICRPRAWLHKKEFYCQQRPPSVGFNYLRRSKATWHLIVLLKFLEARCQGTVLQQSYYSSLYMSNPNYRSHYSIFQRLTPLQSIIKHISQWVIKRIHNIS